MLIDAVRSPESASLPALRERGRGRKVRAADVGAVTRRTAATGVSWHGPGAWGDERGAVERTRQRATTASVAVGGDTRRHAWLPCLDKVIS